VASDEHDRRVDDITGSRGAAELPGGSGEAIIKRHDLAQPRT
jgi:hypothetical protein